MAYFASRVLLCEEVWVAHMNESMVGFIALDGNHVYDLYIAPAHQGRGIGDQLLAKAKQLRREGTEAAAFQRSAKARRFYEARGFVASEFTGGSHNEEREPEVLYIWLPRP